jgi:multiple sugar transport system permease protein
MRWRLWLLMLPALALLLALFAGPMLHYLWLSTQAQSVLTGLQPRPVGMEQWLRLWHDARFWQDAGQTLRFALTSVGLEMLLGLAMALLLHQPLQGRASLRTVSLLPWALPTTVMALGWRWIFNDPYGPINGLLAQLGLAPVAFLSDPALTWMATVAADTWKTTPFVALLLLAGLQGIPADLYEAAQLEGADRWQCLRRITLPLLTPYLLIAVLFRLAQALGVFDLIQVLTGGGPAGSTESLALYAYLNAMRFLDFGYSATLMLGSFMLLLTLCGAVALLLWWRPAGQRPARGVR